SVDGGAGQPIPVNGSVTFNGESTGSHSVALSDIATNCTVSGGNTQTVSVPSGGTATAAFSVSCTATTGNLTVSTSTTGSSLDPDGYTGAVDRDERQLHIHEPRGDEPHGGADGAEQLLDHQRRRVALGDGAVGRDSDRLLHGELHDAAREPDGADEHHGLERAEQLHGGGGWRSGADDRDERQLHVHQPRGDEPHGGADGAEQLLDHQRQRLTLSDGAVGWDSDRLLHGELHHATGELDGADEHEPLERTEQLHGGDGWRSGAGERDE